MEILVAAFVVAACLFAISLVMVVIWQESRIKAQIAEDTCAAHDAFLCNECFDHTPTPQPVRPEWIYGNRARLMTVPRKRPVVRSRRSSTL